jgi:N-acetylglucosaminyldiphosphoundecaprenol N-acetyl-beta-D-mannosaminyltransferase
MHSALAVLIDLVETPRKARRSSGLVVTLNPEIVMRARRDRAFTAVIESASLVIPDGVGVVRALRRRGFRHTERVGGVDLLLRYFPIAAQRGHRIALAGAGPGIAAAARSKLEARFPGLDLVAADSGAPDAALADRLRMVKPDLVLAAFGAGLQETFVVRYLGAIGAAAGIGVGGAIDYFGERVRRAPEPIRDAGLEWAWRLTTQPWRLRRQLVLPRYWWLERREQGARQRSASASPAR